MILACFRENHATNGDSNNILPTVADQSTPGKWKTLRDLRGRETSTKPAIIVVNWFVALMWKRHEEATELRIIQTMSDSSNRFEKH